MTSRNNDTERIETESREELFVALAQAVLEKQGLSPEEVEDLLDEAVAAEAAEASEQPQRQEQPQKQEPSSASAVTARKPKVRKRVNKALVIALVILEIAAIGAAFGFLQVTKVQSRFARAVRHGVTSGWALRNNEVQIQERKAVHNTSFIDLEYDAVNGFKGMSIGGGKLGKLSKKYINALEECRKVAKKYDPNKNYDAFWSHFSEPYGQRVEALYDLYKGGYDIDLDDDEFREQRDCLLLRGWSLKKTDQIEFKRVDGTDGDSEEDTEGNAEGSEDAGNEENAESEGAAPLTAFAATVTNDSGYALEYINIDVGLYDKDGELIEVTSAYADNIKKGSEFELKCYQTEEAEAASYLITSVQCEKRDTSAKKTKAAAAKKAKQEKE